MQPFLHACVMSVHASSLPSKRPALLVATSESTDQGSRICSKLIQTAGSITRPRIMEVLTFASLLIPKVMPALPGSWLRPPLEGMQDSWRPILQQWIDTHVSGQVWSCRGQFNCWPKKSSLAFNEKYAAATVAIFPAANPDEILLALLNRTREFRGEVVAIVVILSPFNA